MKENNKQFGTWQEGRLSVPNAFALLHTNMKSRGLDLDEALKNSPMGIKFTVVYRPPVEADPFAIEMTAIKVEYRDERKA